RPAAQAVGPYLCGSAAVVAARAGAVPRAGAPRRLGRPVRVAADGFEPLDSPRRLPLRRLGSVGASRLFRVPGRELRTRRGGGAAIVAGRVGTFLIPGANRAGAQLAGNRVGRMGLESRLELRALALRRLADA